MERQVTLLYRKLETLGGDIVARFVPKVTANAAGWYHYPQCWQCNNGPWGYCGYNAQCEAYWNGSKYTTAYCFC
jgi:hypothetical protein